MTIKGSTVKQSCVAPKPLNKEFAKRLLKETEQKEGFKPMSTEARERFLKGIYSDY